MMDGEGQAPRHKATTIELTPSCAVFIWQEAYLSGFKDMGWDLRSEGAIAMPYGVALSVGAILVTLWQFKIHVGRLLGVSE